MGRGKNLNLNGYEITVMRRTMTMREIANKLNVSVWSLYGWCRNNGVIVSRATDFEIEDLFIQTKSIKQTAIELGVSCATVRKHLSKKIKQQVLGMAKKEKMSVEQKPVEIEKSLEELYPELHEECRRNGWIK